MKAREAAESVRATSIFANLRSNRGPFGEPFFSPAVSVPESSRPYGAVALAPLEGALLERTDEVFVFTAQQEQSSRVIDGVPHDALQIDFRKQTNIHVIYKQETGTFVIVAD